MSNILTSVQYNNATNFKTLMNALIRDSWLNFDNFFNENFNLFTCNKWGLQFWGSRHMLNMPQYIPARKLKNNITFNRLDKASPYYIKSKTPNNFNHGNFYNLQQETEFFSDEEYREILINKYKKTFYSCVLANLIEFLNNFFMYSTDDYKKTIGFYITIVDRTEGGDADAHRPAKWIIYYTKNFDNTDPQKNEMWKSLFMQKDENGDSTIMPIPMNVEWELDLRPIT